MSTNLRQRLNVLVANKFLNQRANERNETRLQSLISGRTEMVRRWWWARKVGEVGKGEELWELGRWVKLSDGDTVYHINNKNLKKKIELEENLRQSRMIFFYKKKTLILFNIKCDTYMLMLTSHIPPSCWYLSSSWLTRSWDGWLSPQCNTTLRMKAHIPAD